MLKLTRILIWIVLAAVFSVAIDQILLRIPMKTPGIQQTQAFYVDFRRRLFGLIEPAETTPHASGSTSPATVPSKPVTGTAKTNTAGTGKTKTTATAKADSIDTLISGARSSSAGPADNNRYLYVDAEGNIQFADSLTQIPLRFRENAQKLAQ